MGRKPADRLIKFSSGCKIGDSVDKRRKEIKLRRLITNLASPKIREAQREIFSTKTITYAKATFHIYAMFYSYFNHIFNLCSRNQSILENDR